MALTEQTFTGGARHTYQRKVIKSLQVLNIDPTGSEVEVATLRTDDIRRKSIEWVNKSSSNTHTVKVYGSLRRGIPASITDVVLKEVDSFTVAAGVTEIKTYSDDYYWMIVTVNGTAETDKADLYVMATSE